MKRARLALALMALWPAGCGLVLAPVRIAADATTGAVRLVTPDPDDAAF
ncbi:hypothetical protein [Palleronia sediminis]|nr:hypothetical protein [Palleronia sediminis]